MGFLFSFFFFDFLFCLSDFERLNNNNNNKK